MSMADLIKLIFEFKAENTQLKERVKRLEKELAKSKKLPSQPKIAPSKLETKKKKGSKKKRFNGKKAKNLIPTETIIIKVPPEEIPPGAVRKGHKSVLVQELEINRRVILYKLEKVMLADGSYIMAKLPEEQRGSHYGPKLRQFIAHEVAFKRVPEAKVKEYLNNLDVEISTGQISYIALSEAQNLKAEYEDILEVGLRCSDHIETDDTGARDQGKNCFTNVIRNDLFTYLKTTNSKSRVNFLKILRGAKRTYFLINEDALAYIDQYKIKKQIRDLMASLQETRIEDEDALVHFFQEHGVQGKTTRRILTEAMLLAVLIESGIPKNLKIMSDGAPQFVLFIHMRCWVHIVRQFEKLLPIDDEEKKLIEEILSHVRKLYSLLKKFKEDPSIDLKENILLDFERIYGKKTSSTQLNKVLKNIHSAKDELLMVLEYPELPLHNNGSERDIREHVVKRKVSGGTRSDAGREARDIYISLIKTCKKLKILFWEYLGDRISGRNKIPYLPDIIQQKSTHYSGP